VLDVDVSTESDSIPIFHGLAFFTGIEPETGAEPWVGWASILTQQPDLAIEDLRAAVTALGLPHGIQTRRCSRSSTRRRGRSPAGRPAPRAGSSTRSSGSWDRRAVRR
jgi:hypothetical protein